VYVSDDRPSSITGPTTVTATYQTQYLVHYAVTGNTLPITVPADEWVVSGQSATGVFPSPVVSGDGKTRTCYVSDDRPGTITNPTTITATYQTQYYLTVDNGGHATAGGAGWYNAARRPMPRTTPLTVPGATGVQYVFTGWTGRRIRVRLAVGRHHDERSKTATATWKTQLLPDGGFGPRHRWRCRLV